MIFGHRLQGNAPPKIAVDLHVPLVPAAVGGIPPALFFEQLKDGAKKMVSIPSFFAPVGAATGPTVFFCVGRKVFVPNNDRTRSTLEMQPGKIPCPSPD